MNDYSAPFNYISVCTGGGGLDLGFERAVRAARCIAAVEIEAFARAVLAARMEEGSMASCPVYADAYSFSGRGFRGLVDAVIGGTPCQDLSVAGNQAGLDGPKSKLFFEFCRIVEECQPEWVFWENVAGAAKVLPRVFSELSKRGYRGAAVKLRASDVGASHQRARVFLLGRLADAGNDGRRHGAGRPSEATGWQAFGETEGPGAGLANPERTVLRDEPGRRSGPDGCGAAESSDARGGLADVAGERRREGWAESDAEGATRLDGAGESGALAHGHGHGRESEQSGCVLDGIGAAQRDDLDGCGGEELANASGSRLALGLGLGGALRKTTGGAERENLARGDRPRSPPGPQGDWSGIDPRFFPAQPRVRGVADGLARGVEFAVSEVWADRLRLLGNGVVPAQAEEALRFLFEAVNRSTNPGA